MNANNFLFKASHGKRTTLDKAYYNHINYILGSLDEEQENRWETYNWLYLDFKIPDISGSLVRTPYLKQQLVLSDFTKETLKKYK